MTPEIVLQTAVRERLISRPEITSLLPVTSILDRNERPNPDPAIIIGEGQSVDEGDSISRVLTRVFMDLHVWKKEPSLAGVKQIAGEIRNALKAGRLALEKPFACVDAYVSGARYLRDPDGLTSHAIVTISARVCESTKPIVDLPNGYAFVVTGMGEYVVNSAGAYEVGAIT